VDKIVALRSGALGDCVVAEPALRLLRGAFPQGDITALGDPYGGDLLSAMGHADRVVKLTHRGRKTRYLRELLSLRRQRFDLLVDFQLSGHSRFQIALIGAKHRLGLDKGHRSANNFYTQISPFDRSVHAAVRMAKTLSPLGVEVPLEGLSPQFEIGDRYYEEAANLLRAHEIARPYAILQPTSGQRPEYRRWPAERFAAVADHLSRIGYVVLVTSAARSPGVAAVMEHAHSPIHNLTGATSPLTLAAIIEGASLYVGYNTGPMHIAAAVGTPIVALYDVPNDDFEWYPLGSTPRRLVKAKPVDQFPGWRMDTIEAVEVIHSIEELRSTAPARETQPAGRQFAGLV